MTEKIDISRLSGADLFNALKSGKELECKPRKIIDKLAPTNTEHWDWRDTSLVLIETQVSCKCGKEYSYPNGHTFLRRETRNGSVHYTPVEGHIEDPEDRFKDLPCRIELRLETVQACRFCFDLAHIIDSARKSQSPNPAPSVVSVKPLPEPPVDLPAPLTPEGTVPLKLDDLF